MTTLSDKHYSEHHKAAETRGRPKNTWKGDTSREKCSQQVSSTAGGRWTDGGGSTGQSWMARSCLWPMFHRE